MRWIDKRRLAVDAVCFQEGDEARDDGLRSAVLFDHALQRIFIDL